MKLFCKNNQDFCRWIWVNCLDCNKHPIVLSNLYGSMKYLTLEPYALSTPCHQNLNTPLKLCNFIKKKFSQWWLCMFLYDELKNSVIFIDAKSRQICVWSIPQNSAQIVSCARRTRTFVLVCWSANWSEHPGILDYYRTTYNDKTRLNLAYLPRIAIKFTDLKTSNFCIFWN